MKYTKLLQILYFNEIINLTLYTRSSVKWLLPLIFVYINIYMYIYNKNILKFCYFINACSIIAEALFIYQKSLGKYAIVI